MEVAAKTDIAKPIKAKQIKPFIAFFFTSNCFPSSTDSIRGVNIFINKIEYKHPSGKLAFTRIRTVRMAAPIANKVRPEALVGDVTGSVSIPLLLLIGAAVDTRLQMEFHDKNPIPQIKLCMHSLQ